VSHPDFSDQSSPAMPKNLIAFFFANPEEKRLDYLVKEYRETKSELGTLKREHGYLIESEAFAKFESIESLLKYDGDKLKIFHFGGHANGEELEIEDEKGNKKALFAKGFVPLLRAWSHPDLVFLNGCQTWKQALKLIHTGIPKVIATSRGIEDKVAADFSIRFYRAFAHQQIVDEAFQKSILALKSREKDFLAETTRSLFWEDINKAEAEPVEQVLVPWKLYSLHDVLKKHIQTHLGAIWHPKGPFQGQIEFLKSNEKRTKSEGIEIRCNLVSLPGNIEPLKLPYNRLGFPLNQLGIENIEEYYQAFLKNVLPTILLIVHFSKGGKEPGIWWSDLQPGSYETVHQDGKFWLVISGDQTLHAHQKHKLRQLNGRFPLPLEEADLPMITLTRQDIRYTNSFHDIKGSARNYYQAWRDGADEEKQHPVLGKIEITRIGWRHICRKQRKNDKIIQSFHLLAAAKKIIKEVAEYDILKVFEPRTYEGMKKTVTYLGLRAKVAFPQRANSIIQVVLKKCVYQPDNGEPYQRVWFYSVYELNRNNYQLWKALHKGTETE
jgi:hypothetical protein